MAKTYQTFIAEITQKAVAEFAPHQKTIGLLMPKIAAANKGEKVVFTAEEQATLKTAAAASKQFENASGLFTPKNLAALATQINNAKGIQAAANKYAKSDTEKIAQKMANGTLIEQHQGGTQSVNNTTKRKMEPKLGQLGTIDEIMDESTNIIRLMREQNRSLLDQLGTLAEFYNVNRLFDRDEQTGQLFEPQGSINRKRYIYTLQAGWIDMHHFYHIAALTIIAGSYTSILYSFASEVIQNNSSTFSYEDIASDALGVLFAEIYGDLISNNTILLEIALNQFITAFQPIAPQDAPNFEFIPHLVDKRYILQSVRPLLGDELRAAHQKIYNRRTTEEQNNIRDAHETIRD